MLMTSRIINSFYYPRGQEEVFVKKIIVIKMITVVEKRCGLVIYTMSLMKQCHCCCYIGNRHWTSERFVVKILWTFIYETVEIFS